LNPGRKEVSFSFGGKPVWGYYFAPCKDGLVFGVKGPNLGDVHLTIIWKDGKLGSHITDSEKLEKHERYPWDTHFNPKVLVPKIQRTVNRWSKLKPYRSTSKAWVLPKRLERKLKEIGSPSEPRTSVTVEALAKEGDMKLWKKVLIKRILGKARMAFVQRPSWSLVIPVNKTQMIVIPVGSMDRLQNLMARMYGFDRYLEYVANAARARSRSAAESNNLQKVNVS
jgi:hypothetical protein